MSKAEVAKLQKSTKKLNDSGNRVIYEDILFGNTIGILYDFDKNGISGLCRVAYIFNKLDEKRAEEVFLQFKKHLSQKYESDKNTAPYAPKFTGKDDIVVLKKLEPTPNFPEYTVGATYEPAPNTKLNTPPLTARSYAYCDKQRVQSILNTILQTGLVRRVYSSQMVNYYWDNWSMLTNDEQYNFTTSLGFVERCLRGADIDVYIWFKGLNVAKKTKHGTEVK
jgi:hypothetical protein